MSQYPEVDRQLAAIEASVARIRQELDAAAPTPDPTPPPPTTPSVRSFTADPGVTVTTLTWELQGDLTGLDSVGIGVGDDVEGFISFYEFPAASGRLRLTDLRSDTGHGSDLLLRPRGGEYGLPPAGRVEWRTLASSTPGPTPTPTPTPTPSGRFTIRDGTLVDPRGRLFVPNGINGIGGEQTWGWWGMNFEPEDDVNGWDNFRRVYGMNFVRLIYIFGGEYAHHPWHASVRTLDEIAEWARTTETLVVITNFNNHPGMSYVDQGYVDAAVRNMADVARRFRDNPYVGFSPFNEPTEPGYGPSDLNLWMAYTDPVCRAIRDQAPDSLIMVCGDHYGQEASNVDVVSDSALIQRIEELQRRYGLVFGDFHMYARWWDRDRSDEDLRRYLRELKARNCPIVAGEIGPAWEAGGSAWEGVDRLYRVISEPEFAHVGAAPWCMDQGEALQNPHASGLWSKQLAWARLRGFVR